MSYVGQRFREIDRSLTRLDRRVAAARLEGRVAQRDEAKWKVRLDLGEDPETGEKVLSPWVSPQSGSSGATKVSVLPSIGEQAWLLSPSGVVGPGSIATFGQFTDDEQRPRQAADEYVIAQGENRIGVKGDRIRIERTACAVSLRSNGRVIAEVPNIKRLKFKIGDDWFRLSPGALVPTDEEE